MPFRTDPGGGRFQEPFSFASYPMRMAWRGRNPSPLLLAGAASLALALASLALPTGPTYDPYAWLIWGRDLAHLGLSTTGGGTSWKPLPSLVDALLTPLGGGAANGWVVVARAGALFAVFMTFRLAWRLAPRQGRVLAGVIATAALLLTHEWFLRTSMGEAEGLMVALCLLAVDRHLDGHRRQAFALLAVCGLIRVEIWPFAAAYGVWLWLQVPSARLRAGIVGGVLAMPLLWFGGDWIGSGSLTTASDRALHRKPGTPGAAAHPFTALLHEALTMVTPAVWVLAAAGIAWAVWKRKRVLLVLAAGALAWTAIVAVMTAHGYAGLPRFLFIACAVEALLAGVGAAALVSAYERRALTPFVTAVLVAGFAWAAVPAARLLPRDATSIDRVADTDTVLAQSVRNAGGSATIMHCGAPLTRWYTLTAVAYDLDVPATQVRHVMRGGPLLEACSRRLVAGKPA